MIINYFQDANEQNVLNKFVWMYLRIHSTCTNKFFWEFC